MRRPLPALALALLVAPLAGGADPTLGPRASFDGFDGKADDNDKIAEVHAAENGVIAVLKPDRIRFLSKDGEPVASAEMSTVVRGAMTPDGALLAVALGQGGAALVRTADGSVAWRTATAALCADVSADGALVAVAGEKLTLVEVASGKVVAEFAPATAPTETRAFVFVDLAPDGSRWVAKDVRIHASDNETGKVYFGSRERVLWTDAQSGDGAGARVALSGSASLAAATFPLGQTGDALRVYDAATGRVVLEEAYPREGLVRGLSFSDDGSRLLVARGGAGVPGRATLHLLGEGTKVDLPGRSTTGDLSGDGLVALGNADLWLLDDPTRPGRVALSKPGRDQLTLTIPATLRIGAVGDNRTRTFVYDLRSPDLPPQAALSAAPREPVAGKAMRLDAGASTDPNGGVLRFRFDFGDGSPPRDFDATAVAAHVYAEPGAYVARVVVRDATGLETEAALDLRVRARNAPPTAALETAGSGAVVAGREAFLDASGSSDPDGGALEYRFDPGDGDPADWTSAALHRHVYARPGTYVARVDVRDASGGESNATLRVEVAPPPPGRPPAPTPSPTPQASPPPATPEPSPEGDGRSGSPESADGPVRTAEEESAPSARVPWWKRLVPFPPWVALAAALAAAALLRRR